MAALVAITPVVTGVSSAGAAVSASDTIDASILGSRGAYLIVTNAGGSTDTVTITDAGFTGAGNQLPSTSYTVSIGAGAEKIIFIKPSQVNTSTGLVTVAHSFTTTVTYQLFPVSI